MMAENPKDLCVVGAVGFYFPCENSASNFDQKNYEGWEQIYDLNYVARFYFTQQYYNGDSCYEFANFVEAFGQLSMA